MEHWERDKKLWGFFRFFLCGWIRRKFNITALPVETDGPYLVLANHATDWDPFLIALSFKPQMYFVASEHIFRWGPVWKIINWLLHPIARLKGTTASDTVMTVMRRMKKGANIAIFADGNRTWTGKSGSILPATGKLAKSCGGGLITYKLEGGYFTSPRWAGKSVRRGAMRGYAVGIYSREQLRGMTPEQINEIILRDLEEDAYARQRQHPVAFIGKNLAEGLETMLCICPKCGRIGTLRSSGDIFSCGCGFSARYTEYGFLTGPDVPFDNISDWDDWQTKTLCDRAGDTPDGKAVFSDGDITMDLLKARHGQTLIGKGELALYRDRLVFMGREFPLRDISGMGMHGPLGLSFTVGTEHYELSSQK
ncbi:MAG: 1-acyl-sn-glycerol-3-phosphate acyltransferase, partial [Clostridia bacterium]|nr:1-acyl-sn-glycerol-3-phosphate acyltransferase [Clostridia bacterium]